jgi:hypothetical protein
VVPSPRRRRSEHGRTRASGGGCLSHERSSPGWRFASVTALLSRIKSGGVGVLDPDGRSLRALVTHGIGCVSKGDCRPCFSSVSTSIVGESCSPAERRWWRELSEPRTVRVLGVGRRAAAVPAALDVGELLLLPASEARLSNIDAC